MQNFGRQIKINKFKYTKYAAFFGIGGITMVPKLTQVLLIDEDPASFARIVAPLNGRGYKVAWVRSARDGLDAIYSDAPDLVLIARELPDVDGLHFCTELKNDVVLRHIPIVLLGEQPLLKGEIEAREAGVDDYLLKPVDVDELDGRIRQIFRLGTLGINCHPVTGLPSYNTVYRKIQEILEKGGPFAVVFMDLHGFRRFNQVFGYEKGDEILGATARVVSRVLETKGRLLDFFGHLGSDDFVLITDPAIAEDLCADIVERFEWVFPDISQPAHPELGENRSREQLGASLHPARLYLSLAVLTHEAGMPTHVAVVIEQGMELLESAKKEQRSRWVRQKKTSDGNVLPFAGARSVLEGRKSFLNGREEEKTLGTQADRVRTFCELIQSRTFDLHFQPIIYLHTGKVFGYEALLRGPLGSSLESPVILFGLARMLDVEQELDLICLKKLTETARNVPGDAKLFFNVSPDSFFSPRFRESFEKVRQAPLGERMVLEVIRKRRIREFPRFRESIHYFKEQGCQVAVDDVRAGTLSLRTILELVPDYIKADISVIRDIHRAPAKQRLFQQYRSFCRRQGIKLISEGVESEQEKDFLLNQGAELGQGFLFSPPFPIAV